MEQDNNNQFEQSTSFAPLADRMRPRTLDEFFGQEHIIKKGSVVERAIRTGTLGSCIFFGPPGTGKTSLATIIAQNCNADFVKLNAISCGVAEAKDVIKRARQNLQFFKKRTYLLLDECHRWNKAQSDSLLEAIEDGSIIFIGSTTENPYTSMTRAIVSRCRIFEFKPLNKDDIKNIVLGAIYNKEKGYGNISVDMQKEALDYLAFSVGGDVRSALNALELAVCNASFVNNKYVIDKKLVAECLQKNSIAIDENDYYDMLSAFCKSIRGSDENAALLYAFKLIESGIDPLIICRRLIAHCSEDIGMANSNALVVAVSAMNAYEKMGKPEGLIPLTHAIIYACRSKKSNSVIIARDKCLQILEKNTRIIVPNALKNHPSVNDDGSGSYKYPHDYGGYVEQQYLPNDLKDEVFYIPKPEDENLRKK